MGETWTIRRVIEWSAGDFAKRGLDSPRLDAELVIAFALGLDRLKLYLDLDRPLSAAELEKIRALIARRRAREPVAYILGVREFYARRFKVTKDTLVPRPDTETLVEASLPHVREGTRLLDLGTGTGVLGITLVLERPGATADLVDVSPAALEVARENAVALGAIDRCSFHLGDLLAAPPSEATWDVIVSNPPYIRDGDHASLPPDVKHEPSLALLGGDDGLAFYRRIAEGAATRLAPGGRVLVEVGVGQVADVEALFAAQGFTAITRHRDLARIERVVEATRPEISGGLG